MQSSTFGREFCRRAAHSLGCDAELSILTRGLWGRGRPIRSLGKQINTTTIRGPTSKRATGKPRAMLSRKKWRKSYFRAQNGCSKLNSTNEFESTFVSFARWLLRLNNRTFFSELNFLIARLDKCRNLVPEFPSAQSPFVFQCTNLFPWEHYLLICPLNSRRRQKSAWCFGWMINFSLLSRDWCSLVGVIWTTKCIPIVELLLS